MLVQCTPLLVEKAGVSPDVTLKFNACKQERVGDSHTKSKIGQSVSQMVTGPNKKSVSDVHYTENIFKLLKNPDTQSAVPAPKQPPPQVLSVVTKSRESPRAQVEKHVEKEIATKTPVGTETTGVEGIVKEAVTSSTTADTETAKKGNVPILETIRQTTTVPAAVVDEEVGFKSFAGPVGSP